MKRTKSGIEVEDCRAGEPFGEFTDGPFRGYASHSETPLFARASPRRPAHREDPRPGCGQGRVCARWDTSCRRPSTRQPSPGHARSPAVGPSLARRSPRTGRGGRRPDGCLSLYLGPGVVRRSVVDDDQLIGVTAAVQCPADALHLRSDIQFLVVAGQDDAHLKRPLRQAARVDFLDRDIPGPTGRTIAEL